MPQTKSNKKNIEVAEEVLKDKPIDIDLVGDGVVEVEDKTVADPLLVAEELDTDSEESDIDPEDLNPFGDRWEE